jgi:hypothetical protein
MSDVIELVDGQIYRWQWRDETRHKDGLRDWGTYHCKSRIAVVRNGMLIDTYWYGFSPEYAIKVEAVKLTFYGDESWPTLYPGNERYYDRADICDMRHANYSSAPIYLRPGAQRKDVAVFQVIEELEAEAERLTRDAASKMKRAAEARDLLAQGKLDEVSL